MSFQGMRSIQQSKTIPKTQPALVLNSLVLVQNGVQAGSPNLSGVSLVSIVLGDIESECVLVLAVSHTSHSMYV